MLSSSAVRDGPARPLSPGMCRAMRVVDEAEERLAALELTDAAEVAARLAPTPVPRPAPQVAASSKNAGCVLRPGLVLVALLGLQ